MKPCSECGVHLPLSPMYFDRDNHQPDGFRKICKQCRAEVRKAEDNRQIDERINQLDQMALTVLGRIAAGTADNDPDLVPHIATCFQRLMEVYGGAQGFAQHFMANYLASKPGSTNRQKQLDTIIRLGTKVSESGAARIPHELLNDEDLQREIDKRAMRLLSLHTEDEEEDADAAAS